MGESGCGKTTVGRLILRLLPTTAGASSSTGATSPRSPSAELRRFRRAVQVVFQDPYSSLNPRLTVRDIVGEPLRDFGATRRAAAARVGELLDTVGLPPDYMDALSPCLQRRPAPADRDRARARPRPAPARVRRGRLLPRRLGPGADPEPARRPPAPARPRAPLHLAQSGRRAPRQPARGGDVPRAAGRGRAGGGPVRASPPPVHAGAAGGGARGGSGRRPPAVLPGEIPSPLDPPAGCRFQTRCPRAEARCRAAEPPLIEERPGRWVRCYFPEPEPLRRTA